jgi:hypothetical protein
MFYKVFLRNSYDSRDVKLSPELYIVFCCISFSLLFYTFCTFNNVYEMIFFSTIFTTTLAMYGRTIPNLIEKHLVNDPTDTNSKFFEKHYA